MVRLLNGHNNLEQTILVVFIKKEKKKGIGESMDQFHIR
jgi:hypothetical protein